MITNILNLEGVQILKKQKQKNINGGFDHVCPQFLPCWKDSDCPCGGCGVNIEGFGFISDLCAF